MANKELEAERKTIADFEQKTRRELDLLQEEIWGVSTAIEQAIKKGDAAVIRSLKAQWRDLHGKLLDAAAAARTGVDERIEGFRTAFVPIYEAAENEAAAARVRLEEVRGRHIEELRAAEQEVLQLEGEFAVIAQVKPSVYGALGTLRDLLNHHITTAAEHI